MSGGPALWLHFFSGTLRGRPLVVQDDEITVGHSDACTIEVNSTLDPAVAARHAAFRHGADGWTIEAFADTFVNGGRCEPGRPYAVKPGDWILFGASGTLARVTAPGAPSEDAWVVFEPEAAPGALIVHPAGARRLLVLAPAPHIADAGAPAVEILADRSPVTVAGTASLREFWIDGQSVERIHLKAGTTIRPAANVAGVRTLAVPEATAPGVETIQRLVSTIVRRRQRLPWAVSIAACVLAVAFASALGAYVLWSHWHMTREMSSQRRRSAEETSAMKRQIEETERAKFQKWQEAYSGSVFLIYAEATIDVPRQDPITITMFGSGFAIAPDLVVTNKHVVQGWKFEPDASVLFKEHPEAKTTVKLACWPGGTSFLTGGDELNYKVGYNDRELNNLSIEAAAKDVWEDRVVPSGFGAEKVKVHANGTGDLVILKLKGATLKPLPMRPNPLTIRAMDPVMALGYPLGAQVLEAGRADLSGTIGTVRFVEDNISHTASIFPGSSGGPLIDVEGRVLGINTWVMRSSELSTAETFGKAIRAEHIQKLMGR